MYIVLYLPKYILCCVFISFIFAPLLINKVSCLSMECTIVFL